MYIFNGVSLSPKRLNEKVNVYHNAQLENAQSDLGCPVRIDRRQESRR
jgi:hypothetical protein